MRAAVTGGWVGEGVGVGWGRLRELPPVDFVLSAFNAVVFVHTLQFVLAK